MKKCVLNAAYVAIVGIAISVFFLSCKFKPGQVPLCDLIAQLPVTPATGSPPAVVLEDPGTIQVLHGSACAKTNKSPQLKVEQSAVIPAYATKAAVFLNGWKLGYADGDHHVIAMATALGKIAMQPGKVSWQAYGALADDGGDKSINWCYHYTIIAWNDANLHAFVDQDDASYFCKGGNPGPSDNFFYATNDGTYTSLAWFATLLSNANFSSGRTVSVLPRGYGFDFIGGDHHIQQIAYNRGHPETFVEDRKYKKGFGFLAPALGVNGRVDSGFVSWHTSVIFRDNDTRRDYGFGEFVSGMGGPDVDEVDPPFSILPIDEPSWGHACLGAPSQVETRNVVVDNVPYAYAVPMLTGWEMDYGCMGDQHVREMGTWLDNITYERAPNATTGILKYTIFSELHDDSNNWGNYTNKVSILGLRRGPVPIKR